MTYNGSGISPVPFFHINKEYLKNPDSIAVGSLFNLTLEGHIVNIGSGLEGVLTSEAQLRDIFSSEGKLLELKCDGDSIFQCYPRVNSIDFAPSNSNWVFHAPYTIQLEYDFEVNNNEDNTATPFIRSSSESWDVEVAQDSAYYNFDGGGDVSPYQFRVTHTIQAQGIAHYGAGGLVQQAWQEAKDHVTNLLGWDDKGLAAGAINIDGSNDKQFNHVRSVNIDERGGSYSVTESWLVLDQTSQTPNAKALEDFSIEARINRDEENDIVTINGTIIGLEEVDYNSTYSITTNKYANASGLWTTVQSSRLLSRVQSVANANSITLNSTPITKVVTHSPAQGQIGYSYTYDDSPSNCIEGAKYESIVVTDNNPHDIFAQITVLGRPQGPILQDINTVSAFTRDVAIDIIMERDNDCPTGVGGIDAYLNWGSNPKTQVETVLAAFEEDIDNSYSTYFKEFDTENWEPKRGRYSRNVRWIGQDCDTAPSTSFL